MVVVFSSKICCPPPFTVAPVALRSTEFVKSITPLVRLTVLPEGMTMPSRFPVSALAAATASRRLQFAPGQLLGVAASSPKLVTVKVVCTVVNGIAARGCSKSDADRCTWEPHAAPAGAANDVKAKPATNASPLAKLTPMGASRPLPDRTDVKRRRKLISRFPPGW